MSAYRRIDRIAKYPDGSTETVKGTPTEGATLDNLHGMGDLPEGAEWVTNEFGSPITILVTGEGADEGPIRDRRPWGSAGP